MLRYIITVCVTAMLILLSIIGLIACAFGVLEDVDQVVMLQTACYIGLIIPLYFLSQVSGRRQQEQTDKRQTSRMNPDEA